MSTRFLSDVSRDARMTRASVLQLIKRKGPISRAEIARALGLDPSTVGRVVAQLLTDGLLLETGAAPSNGGRRATLLRYNQRCGLVIGLDLSGFGLVGTLADLGGDVVRRVERSASPTRDPQDNLERVFSVVSDLLDSSPEVGELTKGIGCACYSVVHNPDGVVVRSAELGWRNLPLRSLLEERFGYPVSVGNESDLGALAESVWGAGRDARRLVWLNAGFGIGSGIVIDGRLYQGAHHAAGEVGFMVPGIQALGRVYDPLGCIEALGSCAAMLDKARRAIESGDTGPLAQIVAEGRDLKAADVFEAGRQENPLALRLIDEVSDYISLIAVSIICTLDPDLIVLGQDLAAGSDLLISRITSRIAGSVLFMPEIVQSELQTDAIIKGAVALALQGAEEQFYVTSSAFVNPLVD